MFDRDFGETEPSLAADYDVPDFLQDDLFELLRPTTPGGAPRPWNRWLIMGPKRSGSTFHIDPNGTSAWNACITGSKKWVMYVCPASHVKPCWTTRGTLNFFCRAVWRISSFCCSCCCYVVVSRYPPGVTPPGVHASKDMAEVATTVSCMEWFRQFYPHKTKEGTVTPVEFVSKPGDLVFVPRGWWHVVLNISDGPTIAITQNLCSPRGLRHVLDFFRTKPDQVSGLDRQWRDGMFARFVACLQKSRPDLIEPYLRDLERKQQIAAARRDTFRHVLKRRSGAASCSSGSAAGSAVGSGSAPGSGAGSGAGAGSSATGADVGTAETGGFRFNFGREAAATSTSSTSGGDAGAPFAFAFDLPATK